MQAKQNDIGLVWFRNDLRVNDNSVLSEAIKNHKSVIACYCFDPRHYEITTYGFKKTEKYRAQFLIETIEDLKINLNAIHVELLVYHEVPEQILPALVKQHHIKSIYLQKEWTSEETQVLKNVKFTLPKFLQFHERYDQFLYHPNDIDLRFDEISNVFTVFRKKVEKYGNVRVSEDLQTLEKIKHFNNDTQIPTLKDLGLTSFEVDPNSAFPFKGGEKSALHRLNNYLFATKNIEFYKKTRNGLIGIDYSSKFSPWLANGSISARTIYWNIKKFEENHIKNESTYWLIFELIWRDYFKYVSLKYQNDIFKIGGILRKDYDWNSNAHNIQKWINGETESSFVNANMREIKKTGWMSNRGRQNVASFFAKELLQDWRIGAAYFESMLIDYDVHSNYGNWMYVAGVGNDPRDRKFNVRLQAERYDSQGQFQQMWLQETLF
ncbi:DASH family cryptochrome [Psychroserpens damuponensis]|uniref:DASH family cryptochrome n=1 Tax=Psychroserpens damuponensis TaxID=943936 RepID=UPI00058E2384|nr:DASH family cryptochrome [Psychroserpens damuponensis]